MGNLWGGRTKEEVKALFKNSNQFERQSKQQARADWNRSFYGGGGGATPLSEFENNKNTRYARDVVGWDKSQDLRRKAEAADVGATPPPGGGRFDRRYNYTTNEMEWVEKDPSNFWKANKDQLIGLGGAILGTILLPGVGTSLGYSLAKTGRDIYKTRDARRDLKDAKRDWEYQQAQQEALYAPQGGNLFRSVGEGVAEWSTADKERHMRKGTYERRAT